MGDDVQPSSVTYDIKNARIIFSQYVKEYNKQYKNDQEYNRRFKIFVKNLVEINKRNKNSRSQIYSITKFVDLTEEEFGARYTGFVDNIGRTNFDNESIPVEYLLTDTEAPEEFDWRQMGVVANVKIQGECSSCWAFAATGVAESQFAMKHSKLIPLSEQQLVDCWSPGGGCQTGSIPHLALDGIAEMGGFMSSQDYPYITKQGSCMFKSDKVIVQVKRGYTVTVQDEEDLKKLVHQNGPLAIALYAGGSFSSYRGRVFMPNERDCPANAKANHAVLLVGYGVEGGVPFWIIKNSYGQNWGEQGYMKLVRGKKACSILSYVASGEVV
ncbi:uncharacterized protein [Battus philenor]|uniref:uncharacterized protein n=1 Tax=Battus philenor TaxID=42288 RepID=UPI0035D112D6